MTPAELTAARKELRLSQHELAGWLGVPPNRISQWERGKARIPPYMYLTMIGVAFKTRDIAGIVAEVVTRMTKTGEPLS